MVQQKEDQEKWQQELERKIKAEKAKREAGRDAGTYRKGDERILRQGDFVARVLADAHEKLKRKYRLAAGGYTLDSLIERGVHLVRERQYSIEPKKC
jgi:hypothetical protein